VLLDIAQVGEDVVDGPINRYAFLDTRGTTPFHCVHPGCARDGLPLYALLALP
jgi:hypothetical protein